MGSGTTNVLSPMAKLELASVNESVALKTPEGFGVAAARWMLPTCTVPSTPGAEHCDTELFLLGAEELEKGNPVGAAALLERAVALMHNHAAAYYHLGRCLQKTGDARGAIANYERALFFNPGLADAHWDLGSAFLQIDAVNAAIACFKRAIELAPGLPEAHFNLGRALIVHGESFAAIDESRKAVALEPTSAGNWAEFGNAVAAHGCGDLSEPAVPRIPVSLKALAMRPSTDSRPAYACDFKLKQIRNSTFTAVLQRKPKLVR